MSFFWRYISLFKYFFIILTYNCFWIIFLSSFWKFHNSLAIWLSIKFILFLIIHSYINLRSSIIFCLYFKRYIHFFMYFLIILICNSFLIILLEMFWNLRNSVNDFRTNWISSCFCCFLNCFLWSSFKCIYYRLFTMIKKFLIIFLPLLLPLLLPIYLVKVKIP